MFLTIYLTVRLFSLPGFAELLIVRGLFGDDKAANKYQIQIKAKNIVMIMHQK
jgi:hypothetical protein